MKAGDLRHRIIIETPTLAANDIGELVPSWATFAEVWAAVEPATGSTYYAAKQSDSRVSGRVRIRHLAGVLPTMRLSFDSRVLNILSVIEPKENKKEIHIYYSEDLD